MRFANGKDAVIGVNPDRLESDLRAMPKEMQELWAGANAEKGVADTAAATSPVEPQKRPVSMWWYVMLLALLITLAEVVVASGYMGTQREDA